MGKLKGKKTANIVERKKETKKSFPALRADMLSMAKHGKRQGAWGRNNCCPPLDCVSLWLFNHFERDCVFPPRESHTFNTRLWTVAANTTQFSIVHKMRLFCLLLSFLILLATSAALVIKNPIRNGQESGPTGVDVTNVGVAPIRKCPPPNKIDSSGKCRAPWR